MKIGKIVCFLGYYGVVFKPLHPVYRLKNSFVVKIRKLLQLSIIRSFFHSPCEFELWRVNCMYLMTLKSENKIVVTMIQRRQILRQNKFCFTSNCLRRDEES